METQRIRRALDAEGLWQAPLTTNPENVRRTMQDYIRTAMLTRIDGGREEMKSMDEKWCEYREDLKNKHEYHARQQEFMEKAEEMVRRALERWVVDT